MLIKILSGYNLFMFLKRKQLQPEHTCAFLNHKLGFSILGKGKPVVLVHGSVNHDGWNGFDRLLAKKYQVFRLDLPGFGSSDTINGKVHNISLFSQAVNQFIISQKLTKAPIIALSLGTLVVLKAARDFNLNNKLVLVGLPINISCISFSIVDKLPLWFKRAIINTLPGRKYLVLPILGAAIGIEKSQAKTFEKKMIVAIQSTDAKAIVDPDYQQQINQAIAMLKQVKNKVVLVYGQNDPLQKGLNRQKNKPIIIAHLGHNIFVDNPQESLKTLLPLLYP